MKLFRRPNERKFYRIKKNGWVMNKNVLVAVIVGIVIIGVVIGYQMNETTWKKSTTEEYYESIGTQSIKHVVYPENPQFLYGLKINKDKYVLGENIFVSISNIPMGFKDRVLFLTPEDIIYHIVKVDGNKSDFGKEYFRPQLLLGLEICEKEQLIGDWKVFFESNPSEYLKFEMTDELLPNNELYYEGCKDTGQHLDVFDPSRTIESKVP